MKEDLTFGWRKNIFLISNSFLPQSMLVTLRSIPYTLVFSLATILSTTSFAT